MDLESLRPVRLLARSADKPREIIAIVCFSLIGAIVLGIVVSLVYSCVCACWKEWKAERSHEPNKDGGGVSESEDKPESEDGSDSEDKSESQNK